jgi:hypothetical protein
MTSHLHCQLCGTHFLNQDDLDHHNQHEHTQDAKRGQRGEIPLDAQPTSQEGPAARRGRTFTRSDPE